jgi:hypothetical protein
MMPLGLSDLPVERLADACTGKNGGMRWSACCDNPFLGGLPDTSNVHDSERLRHDPAIRWVVGGNAASGFAASAS